MPKNKIIIALGLFIALLPVLGFPHGWESTFEVIAGLSIVGLSIISSIDKRISQRVKAQKRLARKKAQEAVEAGVEIIDERRKEGTIYDRKEFTSSEEFLP